jgi:hypothetical protein
VNLVIKRERGFDEISLQKEFVKEGIQAEVAADDGTRFLLLLDGQSEIKLRYFMILHKRNGEHIVLQYSLR